MKFNEKIGFLLTFGCALILICVTFAPGNKEQDFNAMCAAVGMGVAGIGFLAYQKRLERKPII